ncbi:antitoxin [Oxalobacteraceae bacterium]|nr:antitoxin [Oxalobacteraceae bacterium]
MSSAAIPNEPTFATAEEAEAYDRWYRAKVQASLDDPRPSIPHEQVMAEMDELIEALRNAHASNSVAR